jgi:hypothetical protein
MSFSKNLVREGFSHKKEQKKCIKILHFRRKYVLDKPKQE